MEHLRIGKKTYQKYNQELPGVDFPNYIYRKKFETIFDSFIRNDNLSILAGKLHTEKKYLPIGDILVKKIDWETKRAINETFADLKSGKILRQVLSKMIEIDESNKEKVHLLCYPY